MKRFAVVSIFLAASICCAQERRTADLGYWLLQGAQAGAAVADIEATQHCIHAGTCREGNPLMPRSRGGMYALDMSIVAGEAYASWRLKRHGSRVWWIGPVIGISEHTFGVALAVRR